MTSVANTFDSATSYDLILKPHTGRSPGNGSGGSTENRVSTLACQDDQLGNGRGVSRKRTGLRTLP